MTATWTFATSGACLAKAGKNYSTDVLSGGYLGFFAEQSEAQINTLTRKDWITDYTSVKTNFQKILSDAFTDLVAIKVVNFDMSGYTSRLEAQTMLDILRDDYTRCIEALKDEKMKEKM